MRGQGDQSERRVRSIQVRDRSLSSVSLSVVTPSAPCLISCMSNRSSRITNEGDLAGGTGLMEAAEDDAAAAAGIDATALAAAAAFASAACCVSSAGCETPPSPLLFLDAGRSISDARGRRGDATVVAPGACSARC